MPELPENHVMTEKMRNRFPPGTSLVKVKALSDRYNQIPTQFIKKLPLEITEIYSKGKKSIVTFEEGWSLLISYGMSGHWELKKGKYAQLEFTFENSKYYWVSSRSLPTCVVQFLKKDELKSELDKLGFDILQDQLTPEEVLAVYGNSKKNICAFLMDQDKFCGIGNYIKAVVLYRCEISPHRKVNELDDGQRWMIWETAGEVAREAIAAKGMGIRDYKDEDGVKVGVHFDITPYNMKRDKDGNKVLAENIGGRRTWWVPAVQV